MNHQPISISLDYVTDALKEKANLAIGEMTEYVNTDCILKKSELLEVIRKKTGLSFNELEYFLYESWRTLLRFQKLQALIPEIKSMYRKKQISAEVATSIASLTPDEQFAIYEAITEQIALQALELEKLKMTKKYVRSTRRYSKITRDQYTMIKTKVFSQAHI